MSRATIYIRILNLRNVKNHYKYYKNGLVDETELLVRPYYVGMIVYMVACVGRRPFAQVLRNSRPEFRLQATRNIYSVFYVS